MGASQTCCSGNASDPPLEAVRAEPQTAGQSPSPDGTDAWKSFVAPRGSQETKDTQDMPKPEEPKMPEEPKIKEIQNIPQEPKKDVPKQKEGLTFTFGLPDGSTKDFLFKTRPIGIQFTKTTPLVVKTVRPDSPAVGSVELEWEVLQVDGVDLPAGYEATSKQLKDQVSQLPTKD
eukprot:TRINITY_DN7518_c0_g1_i1.p1 TRINITY_DN7518_c0_g1~~TRINITY_DN7518_c0_g1_i1.p1  ORF type:complete len:186 (-),score=37.07 TRINITY_DN7518_c0_g1_i1:75-599(-)